MAGRTALNLLVTFAFLSAFCATVQSQLNCTTDADCLRNYYCVSGACWQSADRCVMNLCPVNFTCLNTTDGQRCLMFNATGLIPTSAPTTCVDKTGPNGVSDCPQRAHLCNNTIYYNLMTDQCPRTCNRCGQTAPTTSQPIVTCVDLAGPNGVSDCPQRASLCNNSLYYNLMTQQCPRTCNRCGQTSGGVGTTCVDLVGPNGSNCAAVAYLCNNRLYYALMTQQCPRTCGRCLTG